MRENKKEIKVNPKWKDFSFHLFGTKFKVHFVEGIERSADEEKDNIYPIGRTTTSEEILIATKNHEGIPFPNEKIAITLLHEIMHAIFGTGEYMNSNSDGPLVEWCARCIYSLINQNVLEYAKK